MKKLKFMLAAATAIGLASALQADDPQLAGSTDFEGYEIGVVTAATDSTYFHLPDSAEEGDYQIVAGNPNITRPNNLPSWFANTTPAKVLQLEGGTDPLERYAKTGGGLVDLSAASVYVDTLVQFTVTPAGDPVTAQTGDKLMIYLQQVTNGVGEVTGTNLVAKGGYFAENASDVVSKDYILNAGKTIEAGTWYRLTVRALSNLADPAEAVVFAGFTISIDGTVCTLNDYAVAQAEEPDEGENGLVYPFSTLSFDSESYKLLAGKKAVLSLVKNDSTLKSVGFAGSGFVDDLVFTTLDPELTFLSFTLAFNSNGTSAFDTAPTYKCGELSGDVAAGGTTIWFPSGNTIEVSYTPSASFNYSWATTGEGASVAKGTGADAGKDTVTPVAGGSATLSAEAAVTTVDFTFAGANLQKVLYTIGVGGSVCTSEVNKATSVNAGTTITVGGFIFDPWYVVAGDSAVKVGDSLTISATTTFTVTADSTADGTVPAGTQLADVGIDAATGLAATDIGKVAKWSTTCSDGSVATVNTMSFVDGVPQNTVSEAYLLNTNATAEAVAQAKADFKFTSFDPTEPPEATDFASKGYNGTVTIQGKAALSDANWTNLPDAGITPHFYRAILTK